MSSTVTTEHASWHLHSDASPSLLLKDQFDALLEAARQVRENAYAPYSRFQVGAAALMGGRIYLGCNVENASYGATICAERSAIFAGVADGQTAIEALALTTGASPGTPLEQRSPCGMCRQVIAEFASGNTPVLIDSGIGADYTGDILTLDELLPSHFKLES